VFKSFTVYFSIMTLGKPGETYQILKELYDGLAERLEAGGVAFPDTMHDIKVELISMERNLREADDGYHLLVHLFHPNNTDIILRGLAFVEKYFAPRH
jgi:hypothetical protein